ncbi:hypothetical protein QCA50_003424 [Cerrena zonata]|uniref:Cytochrome c oxidase subunit IV n=1 Tax=Cerrena zonata TaxID=2478898 RepID=A0AAW0GM59_9APHY
MQALRLARPRVALRPISGTRSIAATANASHTASPSASTSSQAAIPLSNVEAQWERLSSDEQYQVHRQLEDIQKKDWRTLSIDEKKAAYYVAFGPHGPRKPHSNPGDGLKIAGSVVVAIAAAGLVFFGVRSQAPPPPKTINKEWEEAANQRAIEQKLDPITGIASEGYSGTGFVQHK